MYPQLPSFDGHNHWYLVQCRLKKEILAKDLFQRIYNIKAYCPEYKIKSAGKIQHVPFFPGYIFAQIDLQKISLRQINTTPGVIRLVNFGGDLSPIPSSIVETIAQRSLDLDPLMLTDFAPGDLVRFKQNGALQDLEMIFVGPMSSTQRVRVLLTFLGRLKETYVDVASIEKNPIQQVYQRKRGTRGKRRNIKYSE
ncbi:transcription antitermination protein RfaH [Reticulibacter mediterranei]|uniref:Transcription antitermination protein RfaH n=1 Tax=Reticulibacter mediterranei TaxID=2778369 RepID=A0A8J3IKZ2_9CHLR|nr:transcription termination/antitermination NusG family protein [Reticulibacter mediterranei]GHO97484.1 transcription antitermination protein RfaH [Reticulibacter mediterranei]